MRNLAREVRAHLAGDRKVNMIQAKTSLNTD